MRDRKQVRLAFGADVGDQGVSLEPLGLPEDGTGDIDRIVKGKFMDDIDRGIVEAGQPPCKLRPGRNFNLIRESPDYLAKGPYSSSLYRPAINKSVVCHNARKRLSAVPRKTASSRSLRNDFTSLIWQTLNRSKRAQTISGLKHTRHTQVFGKGGG